MTLEIQRATPAHAPQIANVKKLVWEDESADDSHIAKVIAEPDHVTHIALIEGQVVGFVDGFLTLSADGFRRWEVDLLAVLPEYRGKGIATQLVARNTQVGYNEMDADHARGLVAVGNIGSEKAFARASFTVENALYALYVSDAAANTALPKPIHIYLLPVNTINYRGVWLEGVLDVPAFRAAQAVRTHYGWDTAGAVIPTKETNLISAAEEAGYTLIGNYRWWHATGDVGQAPLSGHHHD